MGNYFSKYFYSNDETESAENNTNDENQLIEIESADGKLTNDSVAEIENGAQSTPSGSTNNGTLSNSVFETPKSSIRNRSKVFTVFVPGSPEKFAFQNFTELKSFLDSPIGKKKGTRFKSCEDPKEIEDFYNEQLSISTAIDDSANTSTSSIEPDLPYKEIPARRLTEFRQAIEKQEHTKFDEFVRENPRFLVNTSNDLPTIVHIGTRYNALHVACRSSNHNAVQKILSLITDKSWLTNAYATDVCVEERSKNLLDAMLNTPDKIGNDTPLHYACKFGCAEIVETLLNFRICNREPVNSHNEKPMDIIGIGAKGSKQEIKEACNKIVCIFRKESAI